MSPLDLPRIVRELAAGGAGAPGAAGERRALAGLVGARAVVLVEGPSDRSAVATLAVRHGRDLGAEGVTVVPMGGATNIRAFVDVFGPHGLDLPLAGLCDAGEERHVRRALERAGLGAGLDREGLADLGFHVCEADLEDELIRALGNPAAQEVVARQGELASFRTFQRQPAQRSRPVEHQLRRFVGTTSGRKARYARALVEAMDLARVPPPLAGLLADV